MKQKTVGTGLGFFLIALMSLGCLLLVVQLRREIALADSIFSPATVYSNSIHGFSLDHQGGWTRLTVIEKKEAFPGATDPVKRIYFLLPTEDAYYLNGFARPLVITAYSLADARRFNLTQNRQFLGQTSSQAFSYELWEEPPTDLEGLWPAPQEVIKTFRFTK